jgi:hypothetical protein
MEEWLSVVSTVMNFGFYKIPGNTSLSVDLLDSQGTTPVTEGELFVVHDS